MRHARSSESVHQHPGQYRMPSLISISPQCPLRKNVSCTPGVVVEYSTRNDVDILATGSNSPAAPVSEQAVRGRRAFNSQKMRRAVLRKPRPSSSAGQNPDSSVVKDFLDSK